MITTFTKPAPKPIRLPKSAKSPKRPTVPREAVPLEETEQFVVVDWLRWHKIKFHASPNGGYRHPSTAIRMKRMGCSPGFPDIIIFTPPPAYGNKYVGVAIELKRVKDSETSREQIEWLEHLTKNGWLALVAKGAGKALEILETCGYGRMNCHQEKT